MSKAVLLLNLGTPAQPTARGLRDFYKYFFADPFVFDFNPFARWLLRNFIIKPFRAPRVAKDYETIWMDEGSPLKVYADRMQENVQAAFDAGSGDGAEADKEKVLVLNAMAYSKPFVWDVMADLEKQGVTEILLLSMFPQYSTATTASIFHQVRKAAGKWHSAPTLKFVDDLFSEPAFIRAWSVLITDQLQQDQVDHVVFSYHGVPEKTIRNADESGQCQFNECCQQITKQNRYCYRAQCVATTESIASALGWDKDFYSIAFQSRFGPLPWVQPYLDEHLQELVKKDVKRVAVLTPSFISDCLETVHEIGIEYCDEFKEAGGENFQLVPNLNDHPAWFSSVHEIARKHLFAGEPSPEQGASGKV